MDTPGCGMVWIAGGSFTMGEATIANDAAPVQPTTIVGHFAIDAYEVTVARFRPFVAAGRPRPIRDVVYRGGQMPFEGTIITDPELEVSNYSRGDRGNHPMNYVNWATAQAFCVWDGGRLPSQAEWEFAARGATGRPFPWGSEAPDNARACWTGPGTSQPSTCPVGSRPMGATMSLNGVHDLAGSVWEWNADWFSRYAATGTPCWNGSGSSNAICSDRGTGVRVIRGGSWNNDIVSYLRSASRSYRTPAHRDGLTGFRCARDTP